MGILLNRSGRLGEPLQPKGLNGSTELNHLNQLQTELALTRARPALVGSPSDLGQKIVAEEKSPQQKVVGVKTTGVAPLANIPLASWKIGATPETAP